MLSRPEKTQLKQALQSPQWATVEKFADAMCAKIKDSSPVRESEWESIKAMLTQEGQIQGIRTFIKELYNQATDD